MKTAEEIKAASRARFKKWRAENPDKNRKRKRNWYSKNAQKERERVKKWEQQNRDKCAKKEAVKTMRRSWGVEDPTEPIFIDVLTIKTEQYKLNYLKNEKLNSINSK